MQMWIHTRIHDPYRLTRPSQAGCLLPHPLHLPLNTTCWPECTKVGHGRYQQADEAAAASSSIGSRFWRRVDGVVGYACPGGGGLQLIDVGDVEVEVIIAPGLVKHRARSDSMSSAPTCVFSPNDRLLWYAMPR